MNVQLSRTALAALGTAPPPVQKAFIKQLNHLVRDPNHPSLHTKKYNESAGRWQARINDDWRFYFVIKGDSCSITEIIPHPK